MKPGFKTTEFWLSILAQVLGFAVLLGFVTANDSRTLEESLGKAVAAIFTVLSSAKVVIDYIKSRTALKKGESGPEGPDFPRLAAGFLLVLGGAALAAGPLAGSAQAQPYLPWRHQINERLRFHEKLLQELMARKDSPAPVAPAPPIILLPIAGEPKQALPIGGEPKQLLPIGGEPKLAPPIGGPPRQELPPKGDPRQDLPITPPPGGEPQRLTITRALSPVRSPYRR
jgi:hypothetical protein